MAPTAESPVQTQLAIPVPTRVWGKGKNGISDTSVACRRVFVQTDAGSALGLELDQADSVQTVKTKMQSMLNVPIEQIALSFGDLVLKNADLTELRNHAPLLLARGLHRILSTPCFSPTSDSYIQLDKSQSLEVVGSLRCPSKIEYLLKAMMKAMECGVEPVSVSGGLGGAYYFRNVRGESIAIVKPTDEEPFAPNNPKGRIGKMLGQPGLKRAIRIGETGIREVAAYLLDHEHFARVPPTVLIKARHRIFHLNSATPAKPASKTLPVAKIASCQEFVLHHFDASELGASCFSVSDVHRIGILDVRLFNTDRHGGNILVRSLPGNIKHGYAIQLNERLELVPIDHGLCLPEAFEDPYFEWLHWPQASLPFSDDELHYISRLNLAKDVDMLRVELPMLREACLRMLTLSTTFLKKAAAAGLCLAEIGEMMSRDSCRTEKASELELLFLHAKLEVDHVLLSATRSDDKETASREHCQFYVDQGEVLCVANAAQCRDTKEDLPYTNACEVPMGNAPAFCIYSATTFPVCLAHQTRPRITVNYRPNFKSSSQPVAPYVLSTFPGNLHGIWGNSGAPHNISSWEEEEDAREMGAYKDMGTAKNRSTRAQSLRSISFTYRRQRCPNHLFVRRISVSEARGRAQCSVGSNSILLGDMRETEWVLFVRFFEYLLEDALVKWKSKKSSHMQ